MLTAKQEQFVQNIVKGMSQADAYRSAYSAKNMSDNAIYREASLLMSNPKITQRFAELSSKAEKSKVMTAQERLEWLTNVINGDEDINARLKALDILNKMEGGYIQKVQASVTYEDSLRELVGGDEY